MKNNIDILSESTKDYFFSNNKISKENLKKIINQIIDESWNSKIFKIDINVQLKVNDCLTLTSNKRNYK